MSLKCEKCSNVGHFEVRCHLKQRKRAHSSGSSSRGRGNSGRKSRGRRGGDSHGQRYARQVTAQFSRREIGGVTET